MLISVSHSMAIMLQTHIIHWRKLKKIIEKCFPKLIIWNKILQKIIWLRQKVIVFLNTRFLCKNYAICNVNIQARVKWISKFKTSQISKIKEIIKQVVSNKCRRTRTITMIKLCPLNEICKNSPIFSVRCSAYSIPIKGVALLWNL